ncbi:MAG: PRTRC system protein B [Chitinophagaceae bacterium]|nr:PRTRC system protein B [Chitinophagaceae bacterium]
MKNISAIFEDIMLPQKALLIYHSVVNKEDVYVEAYDMDANGFPVNAHPLSMQEAVALADSLDQSPAMQRSFLKPKGLLPENVLYINPDKNGFAIWYTPPAETDLLFVPELDIPCGKAAIPALVWKASLYDLHIYAMPTNRKPTLKTALYYAPFFNIYKTGKVCMGTVDIEISRDSTLEEFMLQWQHYFFNSYFSHLIDEYCPVSVNIIQLWQQLVKNDLTLKNLLR